LSPIKTHIEKAKTKKKKRKNLHAAYNPSSPRGRGKRVMVGGWPKPKQRHSKES
jgi:hypothetical protein